MDIHNQFSENSITDGIQTISYVADQQGNQELVSGAVWQPVNIVNRQAWQEIDRDIEQAKEKVASGRASCLYYYMIANQMNPGLLAQYTRQSRWRVHVHLIPFFFSRLKTSSLNRYAQLFQVLPDDLIQGVLKPPVYTLGGDQDQPLA